MEVEQVVSGMVVMIVSVDGPVGEAALAAVPHRCETVHGGGLTQVDLPKEIGVHRLAPALAAVGADAQRHGQQVLFCVHDVHQAAEALRRMLAKAHMDVDAAAAVHPCACLLDAPDHCLHHLDVFPAAHRADYLCSGIGDGGVALNDPLAAVGHGYVPIAEVVVDVTGLRTEKGGDGFGCAFSAQTGGFNLDAKSLVFHGASPCARRLFPPAAGGFS